MLVGWVELVRARFSKRPTDFVSVDARRFSHSPKNYEMITSPPSQAGDAVVKAPEPIIASPLAKAEDEGLSSLAHSPRSSYSQYTNSMDYFGKDFADYNNASFTKEAEYRTPNLSFSTPRPPSTGGPWPREHISNTNRPFSPPRDRFSPPGPGSPGSRYPSPPSRTEYRSRPFSEGYEWDPAATHAKPSVRQ